MKRPPGVGSDGTGLPIGLKQRVPTCADRKLNCSEVRGDNSTERCLLNME